MTTQLSYAALRSALATGAVAIRRVQRLVPAGGQADKVFPPTYEGGEYATEERILDGRRVPCVLLDSVQSQANRIELAIKQACYNGKDADADLPVVTVDFGSVGLPEIGEVTSLDAPHRLADAILRDSLNGEVKFRDSAQGRTLDTASVANATGLFEVCPTALVFGLWDSTGPRGGLGAKFQRVLVSEIVGVDVQRGVRPSSRVDPLAIVTGVGEIYKLKGGDGWTLDPSLAEQDKGQPVKLGKDGKPSEINHGNVTPSLKNEKGQMHPGGVTLSYAQQFMVLSLPALRRLAFPDGNNVVSRERNLAAWAALAALAISGSQLSIEQGCDLRSRCLLVPDASAPASWEIVGCDGQSTAVSLGDALGLIREAANAAVDAGLPNWRCRPLVLKPTEGLAELVRRSRKVVASGKAEA